MKASIQVFRVSDIIKNGYPKQKLVSEFVRINQEAWPLPFPEKYLWTKERVTTQFKICPHLQYAAFVDGRVAGTLSMFHTTSDRIQRCSSWDEATSEGTFSEHVPTGDVSFGADLSVGANYQSRGVSAKLIQAGLLFTTILYNKKGVYLGSRIPHYHRKAARYSVDDYVHGVQRDGKTLDPEIRIYQRNGFRVQRIVSGYMEDPESHNYGILMFWENPLYRKVQDWEEAMQMVREIAESLYFSRPY